MYDVLGFHDWLEEPPKHIIDRINAAYEKDNEDEIEAAEAELEAWKKTSGLKPNAPQSAKDAYEKYLKATSQTNEYGEKVLF